jgi:hypothetical protein
MEQFPVARPQADLNDRLPWTTYGSRAGKDLNRDAQHDHERKISYARTFLS